MAGRSDLGRNLSKQWKPEVRELLEEMSARHMGPKWPIVEECCHVFMAFDYVKDLYDLYEMPGKEQGQLKVPPALEWAVKAELALLDEADDNRALSHVRLALQELDKMEDDEDHFKEELWVYVHRLLYHTVRFKIQAARVGFNSFPDATSGVLGETYKATLKKLEAIVRDVNVANAPLRKAAMQLCIAELHLLVARSVQRRSARERALKDSMRSLEKVDRTWHDAKSASGDSPRLQGLCTMLRVKLLLARGVGHLMHNTDKDRTEAIELSARASRTCQRVTIDSYAERGRRMWRFCGILALMVDLAAHLSHENQPNAMENATRVADCLLIEANEHDMKQHPCLEAFMLAAAAETYLQASWPDEAIYHSHLALSKLRENHVGWRPFLWEAAVLQTMTLAYIDQEEYNKPIRMLKDALRTNVYAGTTREEALLRTSLMRAYAARGQLTQANEEATRLLDICGWKKLDDKRWHASALMTMARHSIQKVQGRSGGRSSSISIPEDAVRIWQELGENEIALLASSWVVQAWIDLDTHRGCSKAEQLSSFYAQDGEMQDKLKEGLTMLSQATGQVSVDDIDMAMATLGDARSAFRITKHVKGEALALRMTSDIYKARGQVEMALKLATQERRHLLRQEIEGPFRKFALKCLRNIAELQLECGDPAAALHMVDEVLEVSNRTLYTSKVGRALTLLIKVKANIAQAKAEMAFNWSGARNVRPEDGWEDRLSDALQQKALSPAQEAVDLARSAGDHRALLQALLWTCETLKLLGLPSHATELLQEAETIAHSIELEPDLDHGPLMQILWAEIYEAQGKERQAVDSACQARDSAYRRQDSPIVERAVTLLCRIRGIDPDATSEVDSADDDAQAALEDDLPPLEEAAAPAATAAEEPRAATQPKQVVLTRDFVTAAVRAAISNTVTDAEVVDNDSELMELGIDSLAAIGLRDALEKQTKLRLPPTLTFEYPTGRAIIDLVMDLASGS